MDKTSRTIYVIETARMNFNSAINCIKKSKRTVERNKKKVQGRPIYLKCKGLILEVADKHY